MSNHLSKLLKQPLSIDNRNIRTRLFLAPMAGIGHIAFREVVSGYGGYGLLFSEMCSAKALPHENSKVSPVFRWREEELSYLVCQIFGSDPRIMAKAAQRVEKEGFFGVDINFGCSVAAICKKNCGAALLKTPDLAVSIVAAVCRAVSIPVFVKFRTGWRDEPGPAVDMARRFEDAGVHALTFHPRVAPDRRSRPPKWGYIGKIKQAVSIPVVGNGNVFDTGACLEMLETTGCDGVAIGRMAIARPWI
ncbi:MAG: tRNA-dihydrouridine synthase family protein, partial [Deltaproteobacteria bacterium]|nr:tRNA-dihydrouridine synthase family protein [Deltaproteobacteria bacterium]